MSKKRRTYKNPWNRQLVEHERRYFAGNEYEMAGAYAEADRAEHEPTMTCGICGCTAYFKSTIGTHKCPSCGAIHIQLDEWSPGAPTGRPFEPPRTI